MKRSSRALVVVFALCTVATPLRAQSVADPSGHWEGAVQLPGSPVGIEVDLASNGAEPLAGTVTIPSQGMNGFPLSGVAAEGSSIRFQLRGVVGERLFKGVVSADGASISGEFTQAGYTLPFSLIRMGDARIAEQPKSAPIGTELEGTWNGAVDANGVSEQFVLTMSNHTDGTAVGSVLSVGQGLDIPISRITQSASSLTLDFRSVGGAYTGTLNHEGTEVVGIYTQGSVALPVTFRRAATAD